MVVIQCPHCEEDVELEDGTFGVFECPYCDKEFEFGNDSNNIYISRRPGKLVTTLLTMSILFILGAGLIYFDDTDDNFSNEYETCKDCTWDEQFADSIAQGMAEAAAEAMAITLSLICLGISLALFFIAVVTYSIQQIRKQT